MATSIKIPIHEENADVKSRLNYIEKWMLHESVKRDLVLFLQDLGSGKVNKGVQIKPRTQVKYISLLKSPFIHLNKPAIKWTKRDLEEYDKKISTNSLLTEKKKPFSQSMKKDIRIALRVFLKWKLGEAKALTLTDFFDMRDVKKTPDSLKESEITKLYKACKTNEERYIIAVLFDSGARAEEFHNIRAEDIELPTGNNNFIKITLKEEYSKTEGRTISLYWEKSLEAVSDFMQQRIKEGIKSNEPVTTISYDAVRFFLARIGLRVLEKKIHVHLFRHSSATYYASRLNRQQLCYRYGWKFSSDMPDVYISRAGVDDGLDEKMEQTELKELKSKLSKEEFERKKQQEDLERLTKAMEKMLLSNAIFSERDKLLIEHASGRITEKEFADRLGKLMLESKKVEQEFFNKMPEAEKVEAKRIGNKLALQYFASL